MKKICHFPKRKMRKMMRKRRMKKKMNEKGQNNCFRKMKVKMTLMVLNKYYHSAMELDKTVNSGVEVQLAFVGLLPLTECFVLEQPDNSGYCFALAVVELRGYCGISDWYIHRLI